jgi:hypothetical protein
MHIETPRPLRKTLRAKGSGEGGGYPPRPQARPQKAAARGSAADLSLEWFRGPAEEAARRALLASDLGTPVQQAKPLQR